MHFKMGSQADVAKCDSDLSWLWVIEWLTSLKETDTAILHGKYVQTRVLMLSDEYGYFLFRVSRSCLSFSDLIEAAPELPDDLEARLRKIVALRCSQDLYSPTNGPDSDNPSTKFGFSLSENCKDAHQHVVQEVKLQVHLVSEHFCFRC